MSYQYLKVTVLNTRHNIQSFVMYVDVDVVQTSFKQLPVCCFCLLEEDDQTSLSLSWLKSLFLVEQTSFPQM